MAARPRSPDRWRENEAGCWIWQRATNGAGYGRVKVDGVLLLAHRWMFERFRGPIPPGAVLDHVVCDTPMCCNPWHVEPVTVAANTRRGRAARLTPGQAQEIRDSDASTAELALLFGVSRWTISAVRAGRRWAA